jgi:hypothetical protein
LENIEQYHDLPEVKKIKQYFNIFSMMVKYLVGEEEKA